MITRPASPEIKQEAKQIPHIQVIEGNRLGKDYVIGDVHGMFDELNLVLEKIKLNEHDRLFIVGDLHDRGPRSLDVIKKVIALNKEKQRIFVTRGNHEDALLNYYNAFVQHEKTRSKTDKEKFDVAKEISRNLQQDWLLALMNEVSERSALEEVVSYFNQLPYIIYVTKTEKSTPFFMVHADLPFKSQTTVRNDLKLVLTPEEIHHCIWARKKGSIFFGRKTMEMDNDPVYCGHTVLGGIRLLGYYLNLDIGTFAFNAMLLVNHTDCTAEIINQHRIADKRIANQIEELRNQVEIFINYVKRLKFRGALKQRITAESEKYEFKGMAPLTIAQTFECKDTFNDPDFQLLRQKINILNAIFEAFKKNVGGHATPLLLAHDVDKAFTDGIVVLAQKFKSSPNKNFDEHIHQMIRNFIHTEITLPSGTCCYFTSTLEFHWVCDKNNQINASNFSQLSVSEYFSLAKQLLIKTPRNDWSKFTFLKKFIPKEKLNDFIQFCSDKIPNMELITNFLSTADFILANRWHYYHLGMFETAYIADNHNQFIDLTKLARNDIYAIIKEILCMTNEKNWEELRHHATYIKNRDDMAHFFALCSNQPSWKSLQKLFFTESQHILITSLEHIVEMICLLNKNALVNSLLILYQDKITSLEHIAKIICLLPSDRKHLATGVLGVYQFSHSPWKDYLRILTTCLQQEKKSELSDKINRLLSAMELSTSTYPSILEIIYKNLIFILESGKSSKERLQELRAYLINFSLATKTFFPDDNGRFYPIFQKFLQQEFNLKMPSLNQSISTLSQLPKETDFNILCSKLRTQFKSLCPGAKETESKREVKAGDMKEPEMNMKRMIERVLLEIKKLKESKGVKLFLFDKTKYEAINRQIDKLRDLLGEYKVYVPASCSAEKVMHIEDVEDFLPEEKSTPRMRIRIKR